MQQFLAPTDREAPDHAEVDEGDAVARQVEHVAGVWVGMEQAILHDLLEHGLRTALGKQAAVKAGSVKPGGFVTRDAVHEVLHVDTLLREVPVHLGHHDPGQGRHVGRDALGAAAFAGQVQFALQRAGEFTHQQLRAVGFERGQLGLGQSGQAAEQAQIGRDGLADAGAADLDHHLGAIFQLRAVYLRDRCGGHGFGVEAGEHVLGLATQVLTQLRAQLVQRQGRHAAVQFFELGDVLGPEQVGAASQDLPELDEGGAQFLDGQAHLHRRFEPGEVGRVIPLEGVAGAFEPVGQAQAAHAVTKAMTDENAQDLVQAPHVAGRAQGFDQHGRGLTGRR